MSMEIPPKKPHFFKPILPGFKNGLNIPIGFLKYLKGHDRIEHVVLKRAGKKWLVKANGRRLEEGNWREFVEELNLEVGDILVFKHEGEMEFEVSVFDSSQCDREYVEYMKIRREGKETGKGVEEEGEDEDEVEEDVDEDEIDKEEEGEDEDEVEEDVDEDEIDKEEEGEDEDEVEEDVDEDEIDKEEDEGDREYVEYMQIQQERKEKGKGVEEEGEEEDEDKDEDDDEEDENNDEDEDDEDEDEYDEDENDEDYEGEEVATHDKPLGQSHFECTIRQYCLSGGFLWIPQHFAFANGLINRNKKHFGLIINDERETRSWNLTLNSCKTQAYIGDGWRKFRVDNRLKEGDRILFEIVAKGEPQIWKFRVVFSNVETPIRKFQEKPKAKIKTSGKDFSDIEAAKDMNLDHSRFIRTIRPCCLSKHFLVSSQVHQTKNKHTQENDADEDDEDDEEEEDEEDENNDDDEEDDDEDENNDGDDDEDDNDEELDESEQVATHDKPYGQSHFECTIRQYCLSGGFLWIPQHFALANGLINRNKKHFGLILIDERQTRSWNLTLNSCKTQAYIGDGWRKFSVDNCLKEGDHIRFDIVAKGELQVWKYQVFSNVETPIRRFQEKPKAKIKTSGKDFSDIEAAKDMNLDHSRFICTIRPYCLSKHFLHIPKQFAQQNGLNDRKCMMIMRDEQDSWTFSVYTSGRNTYIGSGWHEFCNAKCLKEGDRLMFEIVSNGETPIFRFHDLRGSPSLQAEVKKKNLDAERKLDEELRLKTSNTTTTPKSQVAAASTSADGNSFFVSTIKPYIVRNLVLYLPMDFVRSNGLMDKRETILVDEKQRSWSVWLGRIGHHFGIKRGWRQFIKANGVQVGDTYKFELTNNGTIPIVHFYCKYSGKDAKPLKHLLRE